MPPIAGVPIVLQNTASNVMLAVTTDANGRFTFTNVPDGAYRIVEAYGTAASQSSTGDFSQAQIGSPAPPATPPISFAPTAGPAANQLDAVTPNPLNITVTGSDITGQTMLNGPVEVPTDLTISKTTQQQTAMIGEALNYTVTLTNNGPGMARNIVVTDQFPDTLQNAEYSLDGGTTWNPWNGTFRGNTMRNGVVFNLLLRGTVAPSASGDLSNTASITSSTTDPNLNNNSSTSTIPVAATRRHVSSVCCSVSALQGPEIISGRFAFRSIVFICLFCFI
jgi:uncharacterized repeat protein (TIGR01451 family)